MIEVARVVDKRGRRWDQIAIDEVLACVRLFGHVGLFEDVRVERGLLLSCNCILNDLVLGFFDDLGAKG